MLQYRAADFIVYVYLDECYDARNLVSCEDEMEKGNCGDVEIAHVCSQTCQTLSCSQVTWPALLSSLILNAMTSKN